MNNKKKGLFPNRGPSSFQALFCITLNIFFDNILRNLFQQLLKIIQYNTIIFYAPYHKIWGTIYSILVTYK